jgi:phage gpG-like protein
MFKLAVKRVDKGWKAIKRISSEAARANDVVKVGLLGDHKAERQKGKVTNPELGVIHEFGTATIPARPFLFPTMHHHRGDYKALIAQGLKQVYRQKMTTRKLLELLGLKASSDVKQTIADFVLPPLAPATEKRKGSSLPLKDTGQLLASISYEVVPGTGEKPTGGHH